MNAALSWRPTIHWFCTSIAAIITGVFFGYLFFTNSTFLVIALLVIGYFAVKSVRVAFFLLIFSIPLNTFITVQSIFPFKLTYISFLFLVLSIIYSYNVEKIKGLSEKIRTPIDYLLIVFVLWIIFSVFQSRFIPDNPYIIQNIWRNYPWVKSITKILLLLFCISVFYVCNMLLDSKEKIKEILLVYTSTAVFASGVGLAAYVMYILFNYVTRINGHGFIVEVPGDVPRLVGTEAEPLFFGLYLLTILPVLYALIFSQYLSKEKKEMYKNKWLFLVIGVMSVALLLTSSRSAILGFLTTLIVLIFLYKEDRTYGLYCSEIINLIKERIRKMYYQLTSSKKIAGVTGVCIALFFIYGVININPIIEKTEYFVEKGILVPIIGSFSEEYSAGKYWSTKSRLMMYQYGINAWEQHPWVGIGYENYNFYSGQRYYYGLYDFSLNWPEVNNFPLKILVELGIIGFFLFLSFVIYFFYYVFEALKKTKDVFWKAVLRGYIAGAVGISVVLLFSSNITRVFLWVSLGIFMAIIKVINKEEDQKMQDHKENILNENSNLG